MRKVNFLIVLFLVCFFSVSIGAKYLKFFIQQDYLLVIETSCNPETEICFVFECDDPLSAECEPYKYLEILAKQFKENNLEYGSYELQCDQLDFPCTTIECSPEYIIEGETCTK